MHNYDEDAWIKQCNRMSDSREIQLFTHQKYPAKAKGTEEMNIAKSSYKSSLVSQTQAKHVYHFINTCKFKA